VLRFIARRVIFIILVCLLIVFAINMAMRMIGNSEVREPNFNMVQLSKLAWMDTRTYTSQVIRGEIGSVRLEYGFVPVVEILKEAYKNSIGLLLVALTIATVGGLFIGTSVALTKHKHIVLPILMLTIIGISIPSFFASLLLRQAELMYVRIFGYPLVAMAGFGWDYKHMLMPVLVLAAYPLAYLTRASSLSINRVMEENYIRTAYSKGLDRRSVVNVHAMRNIAIPVLTAVGVSLRFSLSILPIVEFFFVWPGIGLGLLQAINQRQTLLVVTLALALGLTFLFINLVLDIIYRIVDPRVRDN
jgi:peptide/nickel transport system permease protein